MKEPRPIEPFSGRRFWLFYAFAWLDLAGLYFLVYLTAGAETVAQAVEGALINITPMALFGLGALAIFRRLDWSTGLRGPFVATHMVLALIYGLLVTLTTYVVYSLKHWLMEGKLGPFNTQYMGWEVLMGALIYGVLAGTCYAILLSGRLREQEARAARATALQTEAELRALRAQLNPHFLFNTLHSLLALVRHDARAAEEGLEQFGDLLRYTLDTQKGNGESVPLRDELTFVDNYLALESLRLGDRLRVDREVDPSLLNEPVPAFCLQPLVENSVRHGIAPQIEGGKLMIRGRREGDDAVFEISDDGPGAPSQMEPNGGLGLRVVRERLAALYGERARFEVETRPGEGFRVALSIPLRKVVRP